MTSSSAGGPAAAVPSSPSPHEQLIGVLAGFWAAQAVHVAAQLRLADHVGPDGTSAEDLARATGTHPPSLARLMRALAGVGVFQRDAASGDYSQTALSELLRTGQPGSLRAMFASIVGGCHYRAWGALEHSVRTGETAFDHVFGEDVWAYYGRHEGEGKLFDDAMSDMTGLFNPQVLEAYDFGRAGPTIVDVGGGHGALLLSILQKHPGLRGVVYDQPHVVEGTRRRIAEAGMAGRCEAVAGSFFESVPAGGDAYLMKFILHDWDDARSTKILRNIRKAARPGARLLVVEAVLPAGDEPSLGKLGDLNMLVMTGGCERTEADYAKLFAGAGFELVKVHPSEGPLAVVEAVAR